MVKLLPNHLSFQELEHNQYDCCEYNELYLCDGRIINTVLAGGLGTVEFDNIKGIATTFVCRSTDASEVLKQNTVVKLVEFDGEIAVVRPKDEFAGYGSAEDE